MYHIQLPDIVCVCVCPQQSHSLPVTMLQHEADERERHREEARIKRNSHHTLWDGGYQYQQNSTTSYIV